jgi:hypothetical protein
LLTGLIDGGREAPVAIPSLERTSSTTQEYGLSTAWHALRHYLSIGRAKISPTFNVGQKNGPFWLTMREGNAYIHLIGAPSAYGAIARL